MFWLDPHRSRKETPRVYVCMSKWQRLQPPNFACTKQITFLCNKPVASNFSEHQNPILTSTPKSPTSTFLLLLPLPPLLFFFLLFFFLFFFFLFPSSSSFSSSSSSSSSSPFNFLPFLLSPPTLLLLPSPPLLFPLFLPLLLSLFFFFFFFFYSASTPFRGMATPISLSNTGDFQFRICSKSMAPPPKSTFGSHLHLGFPTGLIYPTSSHYFWGNGR